MTPKFSDISVGFCVTVTLAPSTVGTVKADGMKVYAAGMIRAPVIAYDMTM